MRDSRHAAHHSTGDQAEPHARHSTSQQPQQLSQQQPPVEEGEVASDVNGRRDDKDTGDLRETIAQLVEIIRSRPEGMDTNQLLSLMQVRSWAIGHLDRHRFIQNVYPNYNRTLWIGKHLLKDILGHPLILRKQRRELGELKWDL